MRDIEEQLEELSGSFDVEIDTDSRESTQETREESSDVRVESREVNVIEPVRPWEGKVGDEVYNLVDGDEHISYTVRKRMQCPSCDRVLADEDETNGLAGTCGECGTETCHACRNTCSACGTLLCLHCTDGHGLKDETYCRDCRMDVVEDVQFDRALEAEKQRHKQQCDRREHALKARKTQAELAHKIRNQRFKEAKESHKLKLETARVINSSQQQDQRKPDNSDFREASQRMLDYKK